jgi:hypothetical protein
MGKYVFVVGEKEEFPAGEMLNSLLVLPSLKMGFFQESPLGLFNSKILVYFVFLPAVVIVAIIAGLIFWVRKRKRRGLRDK